VIQITRSVVSPYPKLEKTSLVVDLEEIPWKQERTREREREREMEASSFWWKTKNVLLFFLSYRWNTKRY